MIMAQVIIHDEDGQLLAFTAEVEPSTYPDYKIKGWDEVARVLAVLRPHEEKE